MRNFSKIIESIWLFVIDEHKSDQANGYANQLVPSECFVVQEIADEQEGRRQESTLNNKSRTDLPTCLDAQVIGTGSVLRTAVIFFYISNEGVSLIENAGHLGLPIPAKLKAVLEQLHDRAEKEDEHNDDELASFFEGLSGPIITFDESYVRRLFSRITVYDDKVVFAFKDGKEVTIKE